jgi:hypothetical protein
MLEITEFVHHFRLQGVFTFGATLLDIKFIWFGYITRLRITLGRRGYFTRSNDFYLPSLPLEKGGGYPVTVTHYQDGESGDR